MKKFISILGTTNYEITKYFWKEKSNNVETRFIQKATLDLICTDFQSSDQCLIFVTSKSLEKNWNKLENELSDLKGKFEIIHTEIPNGNNEEEIWKIFQIIYDSINNDDELYVDITHSLRYLPMLLFVLLNYLKVLKNVKVNSLTYGNFVGSDANNFSPIIDLLPLIELQDWTIAANNFIQYGNANMIVELTKKEIKPILRETKGGNIGASNLREFSDILKEFTESISTARGKYVYEKNFVDDVNRKLNIIKPSNGVIPQLNPILDKISEKISTFTSSPIERILNAVKWCIDHELYQQAYSFLIEGLITKFCVDNCLNVDDVKDRELVSCAGRIVIQKIESQEDKWEGGCRERIEITRKLIQYFSKRKNYVNDLARISDLRNDFMHAGFRKNSTHSNNLIQTLKTSFEKLKPLFYQQEDDQILYQESYPKKNKLLLNLSNHPSTQWPEKQLSVAREMFGEVMDLSFPLIQPDASLEEVCNISKQYILQILDLKKKYSNIAVHIMGEFTFTYRMVRELEKEGIPCYASTTRRTAEIVMENNQVSKISKFEFVAFRKYF